MKLTTHELKIGDGYNLWNELESLVYRGKKGGWHQFSKVGSTEVWCEVLSPDLVMPEATLENEIKETSKTTEVKMSTVTLVISAKKATASLKEAGERAAMSGRLRGLVAAARLRGRSFTPYLTCDDVIGIAAMLDSVTPRLTLPSSPAV